MKLTIGEFELDVKAKGLSDKAKYNTEDAVFFLNTLLFAFDAASKFEGGQGYKGLEKQFDSYSWEIYNQLKAAGHYDKFDN